MIFCDTSTLAKYYVNEPDSAAVRKRLDAEDGVTLSDLARAELLGVFHRRLREGRWDRAAFQAAVRQFRRDESGGFWTWAPLNTQVTDRAAEAFTTLPDDVFLRTADCIHLVTAIMHTFDSIHTHDRHQLAAASAFGLQAIRV